jgi:OmpA-OmpF porin, OOP family
LNLRTAIVLLLVWFAYGCTSPKEVQQTLDQTERTLKAAHNVHAPLCAPEELANSESALAFAKIEFQQGFLHRGGDHVYYAYDMAKAALDKATPCGSADADEDTVPDVIDRCPHEKEDFDGVDDEDGCRDIDPNGDEDGDGIVNIDDGCIDDPEDFDGHNDEDGCPETSDDSDGDGLIDALDQCPNQAEDLDGFKDADGCPEPDNDGDQILDIHDACALIPEDADMWEDEDGCPDPDNDLDGIPDLNDDCPNEPGHRSKNGCPATDRDNDGIADDNDQCPDKPENINEYLDEDGCPDVPPSMVKVTRTKVEISETIQFAVGEATLLSASYPILNDVVKVMTDVPEMKLRIEGHTDSQGSDAMNLQLSESRAKSVLSYLEKQGIKSSRLESVGFGETKPIDTNRTPEGRALNRRVEFMIVKN